MGELLPLPEPKFLDVSKVDLNQLVYPATVEQRIDSNIFTFITQREIAMQMGVPPQRGVLLAGRYGTGKTLAAWKAARLAVENGWTFIYSQKAEDIAHVLKLAATYFPAVVFSEDIEKVLPGNRNTDVDEVLNTMDGITSKSNGNLLIVLTTNNLDKVNKAALRPGRLDAVIEVLPPDREAVQRLIRKYAGPLLAESEDLSEIGRILDGTVAATVRECVEAAKMAAIRIHCANGGSKDEQVMLTSGALVETATMMKEQQRLIDGEVVVEVPAIVTAANVIGNKIAGALEGRPVYLSEMGAIAAASSQHLLTSS
jgi:transitional endoplasmic reticulum ATPase